MSDPTIRTITVKALACDEGVEHLVIGADALAAHGSVRATLDIDI